MKYQVVARVRSEDPKAIRPVLERRVVASGGFFRPLSNGFEFKVSLEGNSAEDLNRQFLTDLRSREEQTHVFSEWLSERGNRERFFDLDARAPHGTRVHP
jgi:hypothetical protein